MSYYDTARRHLAGSRKCTEHWEKVTTNPAEIATTSVGQCRREVCETLVGDDTTPNGTAMEKRA